MQLLLSTGISIPNSTWSVSIQIAGFVFVYWLGLHTQALLVWNCGFAFGCLLGKYMIMEFRPSNIKRKLVFTI